MKYVLILMMMISSFAHAELVQNDFFTSKKEAKKSSPGCSKIGMEKVRLKSKDKFKEKLFWCVACKDGSVESESAKFRFYWKDVEGDTDINKVHHVCAKVAKDSKFFYCDAESLKVKKIKAKDEAAASAEAGGAKIYTSKSDAKKDPACVKVKDSKFFYCDAESLKVKKIKAKNEAAASAEAGGAKIYTSKSDAKNDPACQKVKLVKIKAFYCDPETKKIVKVKGKYASESEARTALGLEDVKFYDSKKSAKDDPACQKVKLTKMKAFYCDPATKEIVKVKGKYPSEEEARKQLNIAADIKFYADKKSAKDDPACNDVKTPASLSCYICDPSTGKTVEINREFAEGNDQKQLWDKLVAKESRCEDIKRKHLKKIFTKPAYLSIEKLFNDADKYYSKGLGAKLTGNGKKLFKKVNKAPLFSSSEAAMDAYKQVGTHEINKCFPPTVVQKTVICGGKYETEQAMTADQDVCVNAGDIWNPTDCSCTKKVVLLDCTKVKSDLAKVNCATNLNENFSSIKSVDDLKSKVVSAREQWISCYQNSPVAEYMSQPVLNDESLSGEISFTDGSKQCDLKKFTGRIDVREFDLEFASGSYKWDSRYDYFSGCKAKVESHLKSSIDKNLSNIKTTVSKKGYITINYVNGECTVLSRKNWWSNTNKGSSEYCKYNPKTGQASCSATGE